MRPAKTDRRRITNDNNVLATSRAPDEFARGASPSVAPVARAAPVQVAGSPEGAVGKVLVLNSGSSSIKFSVVDDADGSVITGALDRIGEGGSTLTLRAGGKVSKQTADVLDHGAGLKLILEALDARSDVDLSTIGAVGHRVVHGGDTLTKPVLIDADVTAKIGANSALAPLHNPHNLRGIEAAQALFGPNVPQVAVFDTAFHASMPPVAARYAVPSQWGKEIKRYGFHGLAVPHAGARAADMLGKQACDANLVVCHLGNGASMTAVKGGKSVDTTMGMTPLEGLVMGTRGGVSDPGILLYLAKQKGMSLDEIEHGLTKQGGLQALSGKSNDVRTLLELRSKGDADATAALEKYVYEAAKQIGAYTAALSGDVDAVVFTGGVGENSDVLRSEIMARLVGLGFGIDADANTSADGDADISKQGVLHKALVIRADEESVIAKQTFRIAGETAAASAA